MTQLLITRPNYDKGMEYLFVWSKEIIQHAEDKGWAVSKADGANANPKEVQSKLEKLKPEFMVFNGHGSQTEICGHNGEIILNTDTANFLKNTITFARSCDCLTELGEVAIQNNCNAFIGYSSQFVFPMLHEHQLNPLQDTIAQPVLEVSNLIPLKLIKGATVGEAISSSRKLANKHILKIIQSKEPYHSATLRALLQNDSCLGFKGQENAKIE